MSDLGGRWLQTLVGLEARIDRFERAVAEGTDVEVGAWEPPRHLGPLPVELRARAVRLLARLDASRREATVHVTRLGADLREVDRRRTVGSTYARAHRGS